VAAPVIDNILPAAVFGRKALTPTKFMVWACAAFVVVVCSTLVFTTVRLAAFVAATILLAAALRLFAATAIPAIPAILREGKSSRGHRHRHDGGNDCFAVHIGLHLVGNCLIHGARFTARHVPAHER
jgi:hypothetical protein